MANQAANEDATLIYTHFQQVLKRAKQVFHIEKAHIPTIRIRSKPIKVQQI